MIDFSIVRKHVRYLLERAKKKKIGPSKVKANKMLADDSAQGHALTGKQKKLFRAIGHGWKPSGKKAA